MFEAQPERLRQHLPHPQEVQCEQQALLLQRLEPVVLARGDHELQSGPVPLPGSPAETAHRLRRE
ncbi:hypothetical protein [Streptomyces sp. BE133]|uniref:hypothetical protein n=1 Tax=Streptomyces sp. BE133 TaxID=3002523 RepID=UPI002E779307|nr:hypothetical protein [Streptomyces sp. BE133]MEE1805846.1 hypothetical protein [Streptomyces sp. BE133]